MATVTGDFDIFKSTTTTGTYNYMLAERDGMKAWRYRPLFTQPPNMNKGVITCTIVAAPRMRQDDGTVITTRTISAVLTELANLNSEKTTNLKIQGHDGKDYYVLMSSTPIDSRAMYDSTGRIEIYEIDLEFIEQHT